MKMGNRASHSNKSSDSSFGRNGVFRLLFTAFVVVLPCTSLPAQNDGGEPRRHPLRVVLLRQWARVPAETRLVRAITVPRLPHLRRTAIRKLPGV